MHCWELKYAKVILTTPENCEASEYLANDSRRVSKDVNVPTEELTSDANCDVCSIRLSSFAPEGPGASGTNVAGAPTSCFKNSMALSHVPKCISAAKALITWASCGEFTNALWNANSANLWNNTKRIKYPVHG